MPDLVRALSPHLEHCCGAGAAPCYSWQGRAGRNNRHRGLPPGYPTMQEKKGSNLFFSFPRDSFTPSKCGFSSKSILLQSDQLWYCGGKDDAGRAQRSAALSWVLSKKNQGKLALQPPEAHFKQKLDYLWAKLPQRARFCKMNCSRHLVRLPQTQFFSLEPVGV